LGGLLAAIADEVLGPDRGRAGRVLSVEFASRIAHACKTLRKDQAYTGSIKIAARLVCLQNIGRLWTHSYALLIQHCC